MEKTKKIDGTVYGICTDIVRTIRDIPDDEYSWDVEDKFRWHVDTASRYLREYRKFDSEGTCSDKYSFDVDGNYVNITRRYRHQFKPLPGSRIILDALKGFEDMQEY